MKDLIAKMDTRELIKLILEFPIFLKHMEEADILRYITGCPASFPYFNPLILSHLDLKNEAVQLALVKRDSTYIHLIPEPSEDTLKEILKMYISSREE